MSVAIIMAVYNGERYISEQISSIINQDYKDWNLFVHDDGSSDSTVDIVKKYASEDSRISFVDDGIVFHNSSANFIHLIKTVKKFDYICFCDQDDFWEPYKISECLSEICELEKKADGPVCISTDVSLMDSEGNVFVKSFWDYANVNDSSTFQSLIIENTATGCTMMMNNRVADYIESLTDDDISRIIQHDWYIALICASDGAYHQIRRQLVRYRQHDKNVVGAHKTTVLKKLTDGSFFSSIARIRKLKKAICSQLDLVSSRLKNKSNIDISADYLKKGFIYHKYVLLKNRMCFSNSIKRSIIQFLFY